MTDCSRSGLHQKDAPVQARVFYLFSRFIYSAKAIIQAQVSGELISTILSRMQVSNLTIPILESSY